MRTPRVRLDYPFAFKSLCLNREREKIFKTHHALTPSRYKNVAKKNCTQEEFVGNSNTKSCLGKTITKLINFIRILISFVRPFKQSSPGVEYSGKRIEEGENDSEFHSHAARVSVAHSFLTAKCMQISNTESPSVSRVKARESSLGDHQATCEHTSMYTRGYS